MEVEIPEILITGAYGMLGGYLKNEFSGNVIKTSVFSLGRRKDNDFICDLVSGIPDFRDKRFQAVIHCAGTESDKGAMELNYGGTVNLLKALEINPPKHFVYLSSYKVYSMDSGTDISESANTKTDNKAGESKLLAEKAVTEWAEDHDVVLTIIRPARMFGSGVGGETLELFKDAVNGGYIHIRGNDARVSLVTALDVAKAIKSVYPKGGIFNAADGVNPRFIDMMEALSANAGRHKRMTSLPPSWAEWLWRICRWIPVIDRNLNPYVTAQRMKTLTIDGSRLAEAAGIRYHDTIKVISRTDPDYPYAE